MVRTLCGASGGHWAAATPVAKEVSQTGREKAWPRCAAPYLATAARPRSRAMETQCLASEGRLVVALLEAGQGDAGVLLLEFDQEALAQGPPRGEGAGAWWRPFRRTPVSTWESVAVDAHGTRVTARVPDSTRTTGRTRARVLPMRRAAEFTVAMVARSDDLGDIWSPYRGTQWLVGAVPMLTRGYEVRLCPL